MSIETPSTKRYLEPSLTAQARAADLLTRMTLAEKIAQLGSVFIYNLLDESGFSAQRAAERMHAGMGQVTRLGGDSMLTPRQRAEVANAIQAYLVNETRLGIPAIIHEECCAGYTALGTTNFPQMLGLASTFRPELAEAMATVIRKQMRASGAHQGLAPVLDIHRDPRWGRVEETFGEDPMLVARFGAAYVRGLQNSSAQGRDLRRAVMATAKHFLAHSISEGGLNCTPVHIGPRELRDTFLLPYQAVVDEASLASMMNSYSEMDGAVVAASRAILRDLLRGELGFDGLVVSDYLAVPMLHTFHNVAESLGEAAVKALEAGIDLELPETECYGAPLLQALQTGQISEAVVDEAVTRVLQMKFELGLFEQPYTALEDVESIYSEPNNKVLAYEIAAHSLVLLKNEGATLPLPATLRSLAVIGPNAADGRCHVGDYSYASMLEFLLDGTPRIRGLLEKSGSPAEYARSMAAVPTILESIRAQVGEETIVTYARGCDNNGEDTSGFEEAVNLARQADAVILVLGDLSGLAPGCTTGEFNDRVSLTLPGQQEALAKAVTAAIAGTGKRLVALLVNGRPMTIPWLAENIPAIMECWLPGEQGGPAVAAALFGAVNPGGKLPVSLPRSVGQLPVFYNHKPSGARSHFRGNYLEMSATPLYPFGHGLSYTQFAYANLCLPAVLGVGTSAQISLDVRNSGTCPGDEVIQLYVQDEYASVPRPVLELKGFQRVHLKPGEAARVTFTLSIENLAFYNEDIRLVVEPGPLLIKVGSSSADIRLTGAVSVTGAGPIPVARRSTLCPVTVEAIP